MGQSTILAAGTSAATSSDVVVAAGETVTIGVFSADSSVLSIGARLSLWLDSPGQDAYVAMFSNTTMAVQVTGPGTYRVRRNEYDGRAFGAFVET